MRLYDNLLIRAYESHALIWFMMLYISIFMLFEQYSIDNYRNTSRNFSCLLVKCGVLLRITRDLTWLPYFYVSLLKIVILCTWISLYNQISQIPSLYNQFTNGVLCGSMTIGRLKSVIIAGVIVYHCFNCLPAVANKIELHFIVYNQLGKAMSVCS